MDNRVVYGWVAGLTCFFLLFMMVTPRIPQPQNYHDFADKRKVFGIPNAPDVMSNFPFLVIGLIGLRLCNHGNYFKISSQGERWGWTSFYVGITSVAFGSSYYHLKPKDDRLVWDRLPMTVGAVSILAIFITERIDEKKGTMSIIPLNMVGIFSVVYWRLYQDLRLYGLVQLVPCIAIALIGILVPPKYTHSTYWLWAAGFYLLARVGEATDRVTFKLTFHTPKVYVNLEDFLEERYMKETPMVRAITEELSFMYYEMKGRTCIIEQLQPLMLKL